MAHCRWRQPRPLTTRGQCVALLRPKAEECPTHVFCGGHFRGGLYTQRKPAGNEDHQDPNADVDLLPDGGLSEVM